ncbi:hypothetical protein K0M31_014065 [Melipona bicolor]|uniref:Uncharacterized protein n=1 Tax=Melipona bicolor TaxID=60889 RepID=A0AA40G8H8_9HYME|nr:hypothetical protein K0M31_014065 [Melipona bicolor]
MGSCSATGAQAVTEANEIAKAPQENSRPFVSERTIVDHNIPGGQISYCEGQALIWG